MFLKESLLQNNVPYFTDLLLPFYAYLTSFTFKFLSQMVLLQVFFQE